MQGFKGPLPGESPRSAHFLLQRIVITPVAFSQTEAWTQQPGRSRGGLVTQTASVQFQTPRRTAGPPQELQGLCKQLHMVGPLLGDTGKTILKPKFPDVGQGPTLQVALSRDSTSGSAAPN